MSDQKPILALRGVNKSFGPIDVLHDINLEVRAGEVLCLLGDNGAGKSTLIKIMSGVHQPTSGVIEMDGQVTSLPTPRAASENGIATVHQFGGTFPLMSIGRSFFVGVEPTKGWGPFKVYDRKRANEIAVKAVQNFGITRIDDGDRLVGGLSGGERQSLAIARAVHFGARVLILDEPTAALGVKQAAHVLRIVNEAKRRGLAVIFITHQVMHAMAVGDHFAVLIRGAVAADFKKGEKTREEITDLMAGGETMAYLLARNAVIVLVVFGGLELRLYIRRAQGNRFKFNGSFPGDKPSSVFMFGSQNIDNIVRTFGTGVPIWTAYEILMLHLWAIGWGPWSTLQDQPLALVALGLAIPILHEAHFFAIHRLIHWGPLYRWVHSVHHNSVNPSPWSSLSMHPVEHLLYWSDILIHLILPSHPLLVLYHLQVTGTGAVIGHVGFDKVEAGADQVIDIHAYAHYLHHKYFEVNYADGLLPFDRWFGTWHDGTAEGDLRMKERLRRKKANSLED